MKGYVLALVTILNLGSLHYVNSRSAADVIVFPDEDRRATRDVADSCRDQTFCTVKPKDYPDDRFKELFKDYKVLPQPIPELTIDFENRLSDFTETDNCATEVSYQPLYLVREKREEPWRVVIQVPEINLTQSVRMERCLNPGASCFTVFPARREYVTLCKQNYMTFEVMVAKGNNQTEVIKSQLPVCCSCYYRSMSFVERFGIE
ncbi:uncharacterized protein LOC121726912 [Aricia agestis]|uniref:uncharacterized protein LOC121726912 n=1 Tax=Aricia agestis TaxID=91739 RepID=UPI001C2018ED|nr:uncharacterized protein LOC121726912 [Aricia agestis]